VDLAPTGPAVMTRGTISGRTSSAYQTTAAAGFGWRGAPGKGRGTRQDDQGDEGRAGPDLEWRGPREQEHRTGQARTATHHQTRPPTRPVLGSRGGRSHKASRMSCHASDLCSRLTMSRTISSIQSRPTLKQGGHHAVGARSAFGSAIRKPGLSAMPG
jgi:hypothetical protein